MVPNGFCAGGHVAYEVSQFRFKAIISYVCNVLVLALAMEVKIIDSGPDSFRVYLKNLWDYRLFILTLAQRDLKIKYAQTYLGAIWAILQPLTGLFIFTYFFSKVIKLDIPGVDYALFAFSGMTSWYFFSFILSQAGSSLQQGQDLMKKNYFPKLALPLSKVLVGLVDFSLAFVVLLGLMLVKGVVPEWKILFLPLFIFLNIVVGLSVSLWLAALSVQYRDLQHIIPYLANFGIWLTPVFYPTTILPSTASYILKYNPMAGIIEGFRFALLPGYGFDMGYLIGIGISVVLFVGALLFFRHIEDKVSYSI